MKLAYYPGCSGEGTSTEYEASTRAVCRALGLEFAEIEDWNCCGSTPAHAMDIVLSGALGARAVKRGHQAAKPPVGVENAVSAPQQCRGTGLRRRGIDNFSGLSGTRTDIAPVRKQTDRFSDSGDPYVILLAKLGLRRQLSALA